MNPERIAAVTGALGFSGRYIAQRLIARGERVVSLTSRVNCSPPQNISLHPYSFDDPERMAAAIRGAHVLYNTYWVRFERSGVTYKHAVENTRALLRAAAMAGIERVVQISITNPGPPFPYFTGKAQVEEAVRASGLSYSLLRPAVLFGPEDILINNIAWLLRRLPLFLIPGNGRYRLQPIFVDDVAELAVSEGARTGNQVIDAVGPENFEFEDLVRLIRRTVGSRAAVVHAPPRLALFASAVVGPVLRDLVLSKEEIDGLMAGLLATSSPPAGATRLSDWLHDHSAVVGTRYASELRRHYMGQQHYAPAM